MNWTPNHRRTLGTLVVVASLIWLGCSTGPERIGLIGGTDHFPLLESRVLRYQETHGGDVKTYTMTLLYLGGNAARTYEARFKGIDMGTCSFISHGKQVAFLSSKALTAYYDSPEYRQIWVDENAQKGDAWEDQDTGTQTVMAGFEDVTVPAGKFEQCYKTVTTGADAFLDSLKAWNDKGLITRENYLDQAANAKIVIVRWFATGVGLVKEQIGSPDFVRELMEIVKAGTGKADTTSAP